MRDVSLDVSSLPPFSTITYNKFLFLDRLVPLGL
jgi:hypothetical protein